jgi:hypothetical protein
MVGTLMHGENHFVVPGPVTQVGQSRETWELKGRVA